MKRFMFVSILLLLLLPISVEAFNYQTGTCTSNDCLGAQIAHMRTTLAEFERVAGYRVRGYIVYADRKDAFVWQTGMLQNQTEAGLIIANIRQQCRCEPRIIIFDSDGVIY